MFTGIIEEIGSVREVRGESSTLTLALTAPGMTSNLKVGDSVAVDGVCLTVTGCYGDWFSADVMPGTFRKTTLCDLRSGNRVNLERAMKADGRFDGHMVQGHVDGVGHILRVHSEASAAVFTLSAPRSVMVHLVSQGSVAVDGISLTVAFLRDDHFGVSLIPHTRTHTTLDYKGKGDRVNLEGDIIGKYVARMLGETGRPGITEDFLRQKGFR